MNQLKDAISRIVNYYNTINPDLGVKGIAGKNIVSQRGEPYQNTCATFIHNIQYSGSPTRYTAIIDGEPVVRIRYEPMLQVRTVFTGSDSLENSAWHYQRIREYLTANFTDMSLRNWGRFVDASIFFEARYLNRYQSDAAYLVYLEADDNTPPIGSLTELLKAYSDQSFTELLTERTIEVP